MLSEQLLELVPGAAEVRGVQQLTGGASRETWSFDALIDGQWRPLVLRRGRSDRGSMTVEALAFEAAARAGVPEPRIVARGDSFLLMERVEGETIARRSGSLVPARGWPNSAARSSPGSIQSRLRRSQASRRAIRSPRRRR